MSTNQMLTLLGIGVAVYGIWATKQAVSKPAASTPVPRQGRALQQSRNWAGSGVDPFGAGYTVDKQATSGGL
jgi:hypothetical protein